MINKKTSGIRGFDPESQYSKDYQRFIFKVRQRLNQLRLEKGLTIEQLAAGEMSVRQVKRILGGEVQNFTVAYLFKLAKVLRVRPGELIEV